MAGGGLLEGGGLAASPADCQRQNLEAVPDLKDVLDAHRVWLETRDTRQPTGQKADLSYRRLAKADIRGANLTEAILYGANLETADLRRTNLTHAVLRCATLQGAKLDNANLFEAQLQNADLSVAKLSGAQMAGANLTGANLTGAKLDNADLRQAVLAQATLKQTMLAGSAFWGANVKDALWQPSDAPDAGKIGELHYLQTIHLDASQRDYTGIARLLKALRDAGLSRLERDLVSAREHERTKEYWENFVRHFDLQDGIAATVRFMTWGLFTDYGRASNRAWLGVVLIWVILIPVYFAELEAQRVGRAHVPHFFLLQRKGQIVSAADGYRYETTTSDNVEPMRPKDPLSAFGWAAWFSLSTSAKVGVGPVNLGEWLSRLQRSDMEVVVTGWLRMLAGVQSLLSTILIGMWALSFFSRPFD